MAMAALLRGVDLVAEQLRGAFACRQKAGQHLHRGGLAAAIGAEEPEDFTARDLEADIVDRGKIPETHSQVFGFDGEVVLVLPGPGRYDDLVVAATSLFRKERDESGIEVGGTRAREQIIRRAGRKDLSLIHGHQPVEALCLLHIGGRDDHAHRRAVAADIVDQLPELPARQGIHAGGGFVENQKIGVMDQRAAEPDLLFHAAGEFAGRSVREGRQPGALEQVADALLALAPVLPEQPREEFDILEDGKRRVEVLAETLRHVGDLWAGPVTMLLAGDVAAQNLDMAVLDLVSAGDQAEQTGFSDTVGTDQSDHDPGRNVETDGVERPRLAIGQGDVRDCDNRGRELLCIVLSWRKAAHLTRASVR